MFIEVVIRAGLEQGRFGFLDVAEICMGIVGCLKKTENRPMVVRLISDNF